MREESVLQAVRQRRERFLERRFPGGEESFFVPRLETQLACFEPGEPGGQDRIVRALREGFGRRHLTPEVFHQSAPLEVAGQQQPHVRFSGARPQRGEGTEGPGEHRARACRVALDEMGTERREEPRIVRRLVEPAPEALLQEAPCIAGLHRAAEALAGVGIARRSIAKSLARVSRQGPGRNQDQRKRHPAQDHGQRTPLKWVTEVTTRPSGSVATTRQAMEVSGARLSSASAGTRYSAAVSATPRETSFKSVVPTSKS